MTPKTLFSLLRLLHCGVYGVYRVSGLGVYGVIGFRVIGFRVVGPVWTFRVIGFAEVYRSLPGVVVAREGLKALRPWYN